jgi:hypothetical protein
MTLLTTQILTIWLCLQLPLGMLVGSFLKNANFQAG